MSLLVAESVTPPTNTEKSSIIVATQDWNSETDDYTEDEAADLEWEENGEATTDATKETEKNENGNSTFMARILGPSANKAGLQSTDKDMITRVIYEVSKVSKIMQHY